MAKKAPVLQAKVVDETLLDKALAKSVADGAYVNFRLIFAAFSPARAESTERFEDEKYAYLLPDDQMEQDESLLKALEAVQEAGVHAHIQKELEARRPAQLPSELVLMLADNAVRLGKLSTAAQAYEVLRIRRRMQNEFYDQADEAFGRGDVPGAVRGYAIGTGLDYDYAAFPEPLPQTLNFQTRALMVHGKYPTQLEDFVALQDEDAHTNALMEFLLNDPEAAARLRSSPIEKRLDFLKEWVHVRDPHWDDFAARFRQACVLTEDISKRMQNAFSEGARETGTLEDEIEEQQSADPEEISVLLLGRRIEGGEWWQYLKELAYAHPAAVFFISRQEVGDREILIPRLRAGSRLPVRLGLSDPERKDG